MSNGPTRTFLEALHFDKSTLDDNLKFKYENCSYKMHIPFSDLSKFKSVALETLHCGKRKSFRIVSNRKNHSNKDRESAGRFIHLLAAKYKYDLLRGIDAANAGFLHIHEIEKLNESGCTKVPLTIYRSLTRLIRKAKKNNTAENRFLSKFLFDNDQLFHLVNCCGNIGSDSEDPSRNMLFWLNLPAENIIITDEQRTPSDDQLRQRLSLLFPKQCLLTTCEFNSAVEALYGCTKDKIDVKCLQKESIELPDSRLVVFREMLKQEAISHLNEKLPGKGLDDYIPLDMQIGLIEDLRLGSEALLSDDNHNRSWEDYDYRALQNPKGCYILSSEVGSGKTTFLRNLQLEIIQKTDLIPIFLEASEVETLNFKKRNPDSFLKSLSNLLDTDDNCYEFIKSKQSKLVYLVDGLDQISGVGTEYENLIAKLTSVIEDKLIITSRPFAVIEQERNSGIKFLRLNPFEEKNRQTYFGDKYQRAKELCISCPEMIRTPILSYMVRCLIEGGQDRIIKNRTGLYRNFINRIFDEYRHDNLKVSDDKKETIRACYGEISFKAIANDPPHLQRIPFSFARSNKGVDIRIDDLFKYGLAHTIVNRSAYEKFVYFSNQSFQEYLAAEFISQNDDVIQQVLKEKWNPKWKEVIKFIAGINGPDIIDNILKEKDNPICSKLFLSAELVPETNVSPELRSNILQKIERYLNHPVFGQDAKKHWPYVDEVKVTKWLLSKLEDEKFEVRRVAIRSLWILDNRMNNGFTGNLINKLIEIAGNNNENKWVCYGAIKALEKLGCRIDSGVLKGLVSKFVEIIKRNKVDNNICFAAIHALGEFESRIDNKTLGRLTNRLLEIAKDGGKDFNVRQIAMATMGKIKGRIRNKSLSGLIEIAGNRIELLDIRCAAISSFRKSEDKIDGKILDKYISRLIDIASENDEDFWVRYDAVRALEKIVIGKNCTIVETFTNELVEMAKGGNFWLAEIDGLGILECRIDNIIIETFLQRSIEITNENDLCNEDRGNAIYALGRFESRIDNKTAKDIVNKLAKTINDEKKDDWGLHAAIYALGRFESRIDNKTAKDVVDKLLKILKDKSGNNRILRTAIETLGCFQNKLDKDNSIELIDSLVQISTNNRMDRLDRYIAVKTLERFGAIISNKSAKILMENLVTSQNSLTYKLSKILYQNGRLESF